MASDLEKAQLMSVLARSKGNWGEKYDRTEHFKRFKNFNSEIFKPQKFFEKFLMFQNLKEIIKELSNQGWLIVHNKPKFIGISLNTKFKREIIEFIESNMPL